MNKIIFYVIILFSFISIYPQQDIDKQIIRGLEDCYNFKWQQADEEFQRIIEKYPNDPRGYHYKSTIFLWYYLSSNSKSDFDLFNSYSQKTIEKAEGYLDDKPNDEDILYTLGTAYSCKSMVYGKAEKYLDAAWASKKSEKYLKECLEVNPKRTDAYLGLGLYNFAMSQVPSGFKWVLNLAGLKGDRETGLKYVKKAASEGVLAKTEAQFYLSQIYSGVLFDFENAFLILKQLLHKYPDNLLFNYSAAVVEIKRKNIASAEKSLSFILREEKTPFKQLLSFTNFLMGDIHFKKNDFNGAKDYYQIFLKTTNDNDYKGICNFRLGISFELTGNRKEAEKYFQMSGKGNMDLDDDIYARRKGEIFSKRTISQSESDLIKTSNLIEQGKFDLAIDSLKFFMEVIKSEKLKAEAAYYLTEAYYLIKDYNNSIKYGTLAKSLNTYEEKWIKPFSEYYLAKSYKKIGKEAESEKFIDNCDDYNDYDYQNKLKNLIFAFKNGQG